MKNIKASQLIQSSFLIITGVGLILSLCSCANFIKATHLKMDEARKADSDERSLNHERKNVLQKKAGISSNKIENLSPTYKRTYLPAFENAFKSSDFEDQENPISLWYGADKKSSLYNLKGKKKLGDIITLQVAEDLFSEINYALTVAQGIDGRTRGLRLPNAVNTAPPPGEGGPDKSIASASLETSQSSDANEGGLTSLNEKVYDKISCKIIASPDSDSFLIKGTKSFFFQKKRRTIEIEALIAKKDINFDDSIISNNMTESKIKIIK